MRKIYLLVFFLIFLFSFNLTSFKVYAAAEQEINYELPYPGLLPDSPLYFFRVVRDRIVNFLISDPLKKTEFNLLQADKRLNAGIYLFNKGKTSLAISTISKAENYFEEALNKIEEARIQGRNINEMEGNLRNALRKHKQELEAFVKKASLDFKQSFERELKRVMGFEERLNQ